MSEAAPIWRDRLLAAAQSDKLRVSVRTRHLRSLLAEEQRLDAKADHLLSDLRRHEMLLTDRDELITILQDERAAAMSDRDHIVLAAAGLERELTAARAEAASLRDEVSAATYPSVRAALTEFALFGMLCFGAGMTIHRFWFPLWW